ncbi:protein kinase/ transcriptional regulator [Streptomyces hygroscopicus subsp. jinggangensis 5008]|nr:protein kinase/ transcriptional regulator [Streptomyces hygroscopicus subsp. jinggangensis 5008]AGF59739.1 protein kinase/ transcriptional regulator [Streptomyces hygroscopicus subsp. jinggangensis TL01]
MAAPVPRASSDRCVTCDAFLPRTTSPRRATPLHCSNACRQRAYRRRLKSTEYGEGTPPPAQAITSSFVGRTDELSQVSRLMAGSRLVTVSGPPGSGKTRLALEAAAAQHRTGRAAITLIDLETATGPDEALQRINTQLNTQQTSHTGPRLVVLNGCDQHLDTCCAVLLNILNTSPDVRVLATSREPLRYPGEVVRTISGLPTPGDDVSAPAAAARYPAVRLFLDRARAAAPDFQITTSNTRQISALCARLNGLPLAIELAAQRVRAFSPAAIHHQLDIAPLNLLTAGWRTAAPSHRSLRDAVRWSYDQLTEDEQRLFRAFAEAPGGCEPDMARALTSSIVPSHVIPELLASLEAKSLIAAEPGHKGEPRFRMLEPLRYFAREQLQSHSEEHTIHDRAADWFVAKLENFTQTGVLGDESARRLVRERSNLDETTAWLRTQNDARHLPLQCATGIIDLSTGHPVSHRTDPHIAPDSAGSCFSDHPGMLSSQAILAAWHGKTAQARRLVEEAQAHQTHVHDTRLHVRLDRLSSLLKPTRSEYEAVHLMRHCLHVSRLQNDTPLENLVSHMLAQQVLCSGHTAHVAPVIGEAIAFTRGAHPSGPQRPLLLAAGACSLLSGDHAQAVLLFGECLHTTPDSRLWFGNALEGLALVAASERAHERALTLLTAAHNQGDIVSPGAWWQQLVDAAHTEARKAVSAKRAETAVAVGQTLTRCQARAYALDPSAAPSETEALDHTLSKREWQVAVLVSQGWTNRQIGERIFLSPRTIDAHVRNIRTTLGLRSRAQIAAWVVQRHPHKSAS